MYYNKREIIFKLWIHAIASRLQEQIKGELMRMKGQSRNCIKGHHNMVQKLFVTLYRHIQKHRTLAVQINTKLLINKHNHVTACTFQNYQVHVASQVTIMATKEEEMV